MDQNRESPSVAGLQIGAECEAGLHEALASSRGLVLFAGPSRGGRSTTLAAVRSELAEHGCRKIVSLDSAQCLGKQDQEIATIVADLDQHDPDVLCLDVDGGEATLRAAMRAAHRGRLVLLTANGNDSADVLQELIENGLSGSAIAGSLSAVLVQHLVPRLCIACRTEAQPARDELERVFPGGVPADFRSMDSAGCEECGDAGTIGRLPIVEFLPGSASLRRALRSNVPPHSLGATSRQNGLLSLRASALRLLAAGEVSFAAVRHLLVEQ